MNNRYEDLKQLYEKITNDTEELVKNNLIDSIYQDRIGDYLIQIFKDIDPRNVIFTKENLTTPCCLYAKDKHLRDLNLQWDYIVKIIKEVNDLCL